MKFVKDDIPIGFLILGLVLVPVFQYSVIATNGIYNQKRIIELLLFAGLIFYIIVFRKSRIKLIQQISLLPSVVKYGLSGVVIFGIISSIFSELPSWAFLEVGHYLLIIVLTFLIASIAYNKPHRVVYYVSGAILGFTSIYLFRVVLTYLLYQLGSYPLWPGTNLSMGFFGFAYKRFFNQLQTWTFPLLITLGWYFWEYSKRRFLKWGVFSLIIGWEILLIASGGRGTLVGVVASFLIIVIILKEGKWPLIRYNIVTALLALICYYVFFELLASGSTQTLLRDSSSGRLVTWMLMIPVILKRPFLGAGPMHFALFEAGNPWGHPHNWFLQLSYEWGIPTAIILLGIVFYGLNSFINQLKSTFNNHSKEFWLRFGLLWSMSAAFIHAFFSGIIVMPFSQLWFIFIIGVSIGLFYTKEKATVRNVDAGVQYVVYSLIFLCFVAFFNWGINHPINRKDIDKYYIEKTNEKVLHPRYWQQGKIGFDYSGLNKKE